MPESGNNGQVIDISTELLQNIYLELQEFRAETKAEIADLRAEMNEKVDGLRTEMNGKVDGLRTEMKEEFAASRKELRSFKRKTQKNFTQVNSRIDDLAASSKDSYRELNRRVCILEARMDEIAPRKG